MKKNLNNNEENNKNNLILDISELNNIKDLNKSKINLENKLFEIISNQNNKIISTRYLCNELNINNTDIILFRLKCLENKKLIKGILKGNMYYWYLNK